MASKPANKTPTYVDEFKARVAKLETDANAAGTNLTEICREAGVSRATPDRWRKKPPKTVTLIAKLETIVKKHAERAAASS